MASPRRARAIGLVLAAAGIAAVAASVAFDEAAIGVDARIGFAVGGGFALLFGAILAGIKHAEVRTRDRLARGEDVLARWRVDPDTWQRFLELDAQLQAAGDGTPNELVVPETAPAGGVDVVVGRGAVQIGDSLHRVPVRGAPEVLAATLDDSRRLAIVELQLLYPAAQVGGVPTRTLLRFPVADGSLAAARPVVAHFARETPQAPDFFHGPGDGSDPEDLSRCWSCGYQTHQFRSHCPRCGTTLQSRRWSRRAGVVLMVLGAGLAGGIGWLLWAMWPMLSRPGTQIGGSRFTGTAGDAKLIVAILGAVILFGLAAFAYGLFQRISGRRHRLAVQAIIGLAMGLALLGAWLR